MPTYIVLMNWTDQGAKTANQTVTRYDAAKDDLAQQGVTIKDIYWTMRPTTSSRSLRQQTMRPPRKESCG
jgi:GYD domain